MKNYNFDVETIEAGQRGPYQDSYYSYKVTSKEAEYTIKSFCTKVLQPSYPKAEMPDPFVGELLEFKKITNNNEGKSWMDEKEPETYSYKVRNEYTG